MSSLFNLGVCLACLVQSKHDLAHDFLPFHLLSRQLLLVCFLGVLVSQVCDIFGKSLIQLRGDNWIKAAATLVNFGLALFVVVLAI